jgi:uncharacterized protein (DUF2267 family)
MRLHDFLGRVQQRANIESQDQALSVIRTTFEVLSERMQGGEPLDLAGQLPSELQDFVDIGRGEQFGVDEFIQRIAESEGISEEEAREHARAVLEVTSEAVNRGEMEDVLLQLPQEYHALFGRGTRH